MTNVDWGKLLIAIPALLVIGAVLGMLAGSAAVEAERDGSAEEVRSAARGLKEAIKSAARKDWQRVQRILGIAPD